MAEYSFAFVSPAQDDKLLAKLHGINLSVLGVACNKGIAKIILWFSQ